MKLMHRGQVFGVVAVLGLSLAACSSGNGDSGEKEAASTSGDAAAATADCEPKHDSIETIADGKLTVGVIDLLPFSSYNSGDPEGIDIDIVKTIADDECLVLAFQPATYGDAIQSIQNGTIDLAVGTIDATEKRMEAVDFSASTYLDGMGITSKTGAKTVADLEKMDTVGTIDGYLWNEDVKKIIGDKLRGYPSSVELKADFDAGRLDAVLDAYGTATLLYADEDGVTVALAQDNPDERVASTVRAPEAAFPLTKGNTSLKAALDDGILAQRQSGQIVALVEAYGLTASLAEVGDEQYVVPAE